MPVSLPGSTGFSGSKFQPAPAASGDDAPAPLTPDEVAALQNTYQGYSNTYSPGYNLGSYGSSTDPSSQAWLQGSSDMRPDESRAERLLEQRGNYFYGGTATGAQDAIDTMRTNVDPYVASASGYGNALGLMGADYYSQMGAAQDRNAPINDYYLASDANTGQAGQYGAAQALMNFANAGPGPSAAQANLQLGLNQGMNSNLALARSGRGMGESAAALAMAGRNNAQMAGTANMQAAELRAQEDQAWKQQQAQALGAAGSLYGAGRASDIAAAGYYTGANQAQTGLNDQYALGLGNLGNQAVQGAGNIQLGAASGATAEEQLANEINSAQLNANMGYESNLTNIYGIQQGVPSGGGGGGTNYGGLIGAGVGGVLGFIGGGPAGAGVGAYSGYQTGTGIQRGGF